MGPRLGQISKMSNIVDALQLNPYTHTGDISYFQASL